MTPWGKAYDARMREHLKLLLWWRRKPHARIAEALGDLDRSLISRRLSGAIAFKSWEPAAMLRAMGVDQREFFGGLQGDLHAEVYLARIAKGNCRQKSYAGNDLMADPPSRSYTVRELRKMADGLHDLRVTDPEAARLQALDILRSAHHYDVDPGVESRLKANLSLGGIYRARGAYGTAAVFLLKALEQAGDNQRLRARLHHAIVPLASDLGDFEVGLQAAEMAEECFKRFEERLSQGRVLLSKGNLLGHYGHLEDSVRAHQESLLLISEGRWYDRYHTFHSLAISHAKQNKLNEAVSYAGKALKALKKENCHSKYATSVRWLRAEILLRMGSNSAIVELQTALENSTRHNDSKLNIALISLRLAYAYHEHGRNEELQELAGSLTPLLGNLAADHKVLRGAITEFNSIMLCGELSQELLGRTYRALLNADLKAPLPAHMAKG